VITSLLGKTTSKILFWPIFDVMPKIAILSVIRSTSNYLELFVS